MNGFCRIECLFCYFVVLYEINEMGRILKPVIFFLITFVRFAENLITNESLCAQLVDNL